MHTHTHTHTTGVYHICKSWTLPLVLSCIDDSADCQCWKVANFAGFVRGMTLSECQLCCKLPPSTLLSIPLCPIRIDAKIALVAPKPTSTSTSTATPTQGDLPDCLSPFYGFGLAWKKQSEKVGMLVMVMVMLVLVMVPRDEVYLVASADFNWLCVEWHAWVAALIGLHWRAQI